MSKVSAISVMVDVVNFLLRAVVLLKKTGLFQTFLVRTSNEGSCSNIELPSVAVGRR
jgi:hypothetical protein